MFRFPRFLARTRSELSEQPPSELEAAAATQLEMGASLLVGMERKNRKLHFVEHCSRVVALVEEMARVLQLGEAERADLSTAARLHEVGMIAVPTDLIEQPSRLDEVTVARIRQQASIGAEIVKATRGARVSLLIATQYADFATIRARFSQGSIDPLLAGMLRAADVLDTMLHPRPYQADLDPTLGPAVLREGEGTRFHPLAVKSLLQLRAVT